MRRDGTHRLVEAFYKLNSGTIIGGSHSKIESLSAYDLEEQVVSTILEPAGVLKMPDEVEITKNEFKELRNADGVISVMYDDQPDTVAEKFVQELRRIGIKVEILCPPVDIPTILYRIHPPSSK